MIEKSLDFGQKQPVSSEKAQEGEELPKWIGPVSAPQEQKRGSDTFIQDILKKVRYIEKKEIYEAEFDVTIDKEQLGTIDPKAILKEIKFLFEEPGQRDAKERELDRIKEVLMNLPERLEFKPGITLIVGENGSGKTTLARALYYLTRIESSFAYNSFVQDREKAEKDMLEPSGFEGESVEIKNSGLAPYITKAMSAHRYARAEGDEVFWYYDFAKEAGRISGIDDQMASEAWMRKEQGGIGRNRESNRQSVDRFLGERIHRQKDWAKGPQINFFDEPEVGMSPMRHVKLLEEIESFSREKSIAIVPTNSPVLFANQDIPRIDLRYPERGIFKPKDYPEEE